MAPRTRTQSTRKLLGAANSETRAALVDAVEQLILEEGYWAVTARKIAAKLGMKHQVVFYYFDTIDDLLLEVLRRGGEQGLERLTAALAADEPVRALWKAMRHPRGTRWIMEFMALANHNPAIRREIARYADESRKLQVEVLTRHLQAQGVEPRISPTLMTVLLSAFARLLANESSLDIDLGHDEAEAMIDACLERYGAAGDVPQAAEALFASI